MDSKNNHLRPENPLVRCIRVEASPPALQDNRADADRLKQAVRAVLQAEQTGTVHLFIPFARLGEVAGKFRRAGFRGAVIVNLLPAGIEIVDFLAEWPASLPALALDLGTTHLEATLLDLLTGARLAHAHRENSQGRYGRDILSRIHFAAQGEKGSDTTGLDRLQAGALQSITGLAGELAEKAGILMTEIRGMSVSGNTTMVHLLLGLTPYYLCREPYIPVVNSPDPCHGEDLGLPFAPLAPVWILPSIGSYFGGDVVAGILATGIDDSAKTSMLIDVGTNAEVVLGNSEWLIACAGAAGPALEGGVARMGMQAAPGAIEHVAINRTLWQLEYRTIGNAPAAGICGSGLIDLVAELYLAGLIDFRGKLQQARQGIPEDFLRRRVISYRGEPAFVVVFAAEAAASRPVLLAQTDLDALMRSKAAMYAVLTTLVSQVGIDFADIEKISVAGAFGRHIDPAHAVILGMLPDIPLSTYQPVGNSSLRGAELVLLSEKNRQRLREIQKKITYIELNVNQEFMLRFSGARCIPHTDPALFPSVPVFRD